MIRPRVENPYSRAVTWLAASPLVRFQATPQQISDFRRIAAIPPAWGRDLDELGAPYYLVRWIAGPGNGRPDLREQRYRAARELLAKGWRKALFPALKKAHAALEPRPPMLIRGSL